VGEATFFVPVRRSRFAHMEISETPKITPEGPPPSPLAEEYVWTKLVPRLLHPGVLSIITLLLEQGEAVRLRAIARSIDIPFGRARYHCDSLVQRGVLEVVQLHPRPEGDGDEPSFFFPKPPQALPPSLSPSSTATSA